MSRATVKDLARASGWSLGTVSRVLNNVPGVSEKARSDVLKAAEELNYQASEPARALRSRNRDKIWLIGPADGSWFDRLLDQTASLLEQEGKSTNRVSFSSHQEESQLISRLCEGPRPQALIFAGAGTEFVNKVLGRMKTPAIVADTLSDPGAFRNADVLYWDTTEAVMQSAEWLFEAGCQHIGVILEDRFALREQAAAFLGVQYAFYSRDQVFRSQLQSSFAQTSLAGGYQALIELKEKLPGLDGLLVFDSIQAAGALRAAGDLKLQVGKDLSLICIDDHGIAEYTMPRMTALKRNMAQAAGALRDLALEQCAFHRPAACRTVKEAWTISWQESFVRPAQTGSTQENSSQK